ncbi:hypothetical protein ACE3MQ_25170 [Paenibacillus lentus]
MSKPKHKRGKPTQGQHTKITPVVRKEVRRRAEEHTGYPVCGRCSCSQPEGWFENAHLTNASQYGSGRVPWNIDLLCGPKNLTGSCHQWVDETEEGRDWKIRRQAELYIYYTTGPGRKYWKQAGVVT